MSGHLDHGTCWNCGASPPVRCCEYGADGPAPDTTHPTEVGRTAMVAVALCNMTSLTEQVWKDHYLREAATERRN